MHAAAWVSVRKAHIVHVVTSVTILGFLDGRFQDVLEDIFTLLQGNMVGCTLFIKSFDANGLLRFKLFGSVRASLDKTCFVGELQVR